MENFFQNTNTLFQNFSNPEKKFLEDNVKNMENFIKTRPLVAISGLKFPENQTHFFDENFSFDAEIMWNYNIDKLLKSFQSEPNEERIKKHTKQIEKKFLEMIENFSDSKKHASQTKQHIADILNQ